MTDHLQWHAIDHEPSPEDEGRWIVCRFPPQIAERPGRGNAVWKQTWFRCGKVIGGQIGWLTEDGGCEGHMPSHYAYLHEAGDPEIKFVE